MTYRDTSLVSKCGHYLNDVEVVHKVWGLVISLQIVYGITIVCCSVGREVSSDANQWSTVRNQTQSNIMFCQLSRKDVNNEKRVGKGSVFFKKTLPCNAWVSNTKAGTRCKSMATLWNAFIEVLPRDASNTFSIYTFIWQFYWLWIGRMVFSHQWN